MCVLRGHSSVTTEAVSEVEKAFTAIVEAQPEGARYASHKGNEGATSVALVELEPADQPRRALT